MIFDSFISRFTGRRLLPVETEFVKFDTDAEFRVAYKAHIDAFRKIVSEKKKARPAVIERVKKQNEVSKNSDEAISYAYDREYEGEQNYAYLSPLLLREGFHIVTGLTVGDVPELSILDVGAGSNEFLQFCHAELGIQKNNLHGVDVSRVSAERIREGGYHGYHGRIEDVPVPQTLFDLVYLSYFVDYDTDQARTFTTAVELVADGGLLVLEGWFPVRPFALHENDKDSYTFITKGENKFEDTMLIYNFIEHVCHERNYEIELERVCEGKRYVHSRFGFQELRSWFMVMRIRKTARV